MGGADGAAFFTQDDEAYGNELWKTDGTEAGTVMVEDLCPNGTDSSPSYSTAMSDVFYSWKTGLGPGISSIKELWSSRGWADNTQVCQQARWVYGMTAFENNLFFLGSCLDSSQGYWYRTDGVNEPTPLMENSSFFNACVANENLYLLTSYPGSYQHCFLRVIPHGEQELETIGHVSSVTPESNTLTESGASFFFVGTQSYDEYLFVFPEGQYEGRRISTTDDIEPENPAYLTDVNDVLYFSAYESQSGYELWRTDGTQEGTYLVKDILPFRSSWPRSLFRFGDRLVFFADGEGVGLEPHISDGTKSGTVLLKDTWPGEGAGFDYGHEWLEFAGQLFFSARTPGEGLELWVSDGTEPGTQLFADLNPGTQSSVPANFIVKGDRFYFSASDGVRGVELWASDGTVPGTVMIGDIMLGTASSNPADMTVVGDALYFFATLPDIDRELMALRTVPNACIRTPDQGCVDTPIQAWTEHASDASTYVWTVDPGTITSGQGTSSISFESNQAGSEDIAVTVQLMGEEGSGSGSVDIFDAEPSMPGSIVGPAEICAHHAAVFEVPDQPNTASFEWIVPPGASVFSGQGESQAVIGFGDQSGTVSVSAINVCGESAPQQINVTVHDFENPAYAGPDQMVCGNETHLQASEPSTGTGSWEILAGAGGVLSAPEEPTSWFEGAYGQVYALRWSVTGSVCGDTHDDVWVRFFEPLPVADAGPDQMVCGTSTQIHRNAPGWSMGIWEIVDGDSGWIRDIHSASTEFFGLPNVHYVLRWKILGEPCGVSFDDVVIQFLGLEEPDAGGDVCISEGASHRLHGWPPDLGTWHVLEGPSLSPAQFSDPNQSTALFTPMGGTGDYVLAWVLDDPSCGTRSDTVAITNTETYFDVHTELTIPFDDHVDASSYPQDLVVYDGRAYFPATEGYAGKELWRTDGAEAGTELVVDIHLDGHASPGDFCACGGALYFLANDGRGIGLWKTFGTAETTHLVSGKDATEPLTAFSQLTCVNDRLFFVASDEIHGQELRVMDETEPGMWLVTDAKPGPGDSNLALGVELGNNLIFERSDRLAKSDGTEEGTSDILVNWEPVVVVSGFVRHGESVFFCAYHNHSHQLCKTDGTSEGTSFIPQASPRFFTNRPCFGVLSDVLFFAGHENSDRGLWRTDGTEQGTYKVKDLDTSATCPSDYVITFAQFQDRLVFVDYEGLWVSDGTFDGTYQLLASRDLQDPVPAGDVVLFENDQDLWVTDGTVDGTEPFSDFTFGTVGNLMGAYNGRVYFSANSEVGYELWSTDGTVQGTHMVRDIAHGSSSNPVDGVLLEDRFLFQHENDIHGTEWWIADGAPGGARLLKDIYPGPNSGGGSYSMVFGGRVFFAADDGVNGNELWSTDGTETGTLLFADLNSGPGSSNPMPQICSGPYLYFTANVDHLYRSDGTLAETLQLTENIYVDDVFEPFGDGRVFFEARDDFGREPWITDGTLTGTRRIADVAPGPDSSDVIWARASSNRVFFRTDPSSGGDGLWITDGTESGTVLLKDDQLDSNPFAVLSHGLVIEVQDDIWYSDGTPAGTHPIGYAFPGPYPDFIGFDTVNDTAIFVCVHDYGGIGTLFATDGTLEGTLPLLELGQDIDYNSPHVVNQGLYYFGLPFMDAGWELGATDGTAWGTRMVSDLNPGLASSFADDFVPGGDGIYFTATNGRSGRELWFASGSCVTQIDDHAPGPLSSTYERVIASEHAVYYTVSGDVHSVDLKGSNHHGVIIPDPALRSHLLNGYDANGDQRLSFDEAGVIEALDIEGLGVANLKGLESMPLLGELRGRDNAIQELRPLLQTVIGSASTDVIDVSLNNLTETQCPEINVLRTRSTSSGSVFLYEPQRPFFGHPPHEMWPQYDILDILGGTVFSHPLDCIESTGSRGN